MINFQSQFSFLEIKDSQQNFWSTSPLPILDINLQQFQSMNIIKFGKKLSKKFSLIDNYLIQFGSNYKWINLINVTIELINDKNAGLGVKLIKKGRSFIFFGDVINWYEQMKQYCILKNFYENYHLSKQIGQGSSARVYAAYSKFQLSHSQIFAVKCIQKEHQEALIKEIGILRALNHECIIKIHEVYEEVDFVYLVQEYWPGGNLNNIKLAEQKCVKIILQLLRAIAYLHSKGIMHRDIKPKNILFKDQSFSKVCLADFGLADYYNENGKYMYEKCGTPGFVAPELLNEKMYDYKVDIYSIGILMYYLITGKSPFYGQNQEEIMNNNYQGKINYQDVKISETGMDLLRKLLHNDPLQRLSADVAIKHEWFKQEGILNHFKIRQQSLQLPLNQKKTSASNSNSNSNQNSPCNKYEKSLSFDNVPTFNKNNRQLRIVRKSLFNGK